MTESNSESQSSASSWKLARVERWSADTQDGVVMEADNDDPLDFKDHVVYCSVEWEEDVDLPTGLLTVKKGVNGSLPKVEQDVRQLLQLFVTGEQLGVDDAWYCNKCKEHKQAYKKLEFHKLPPILVLQLKRFQYTKYSRDRLDTPVNFPLEGLDLSPYCTKSATASNDADLMLYDLVGVSKHIGSLGGGHYVAYARSSVDGDWYGFDDSDVRRVSAEEVQSDKVGAYVLFYIRRDHRPESFGLPSVAAHLQADDADLSGTGETS